MNAAVVLAAVPAVRNPLWDFAVWAYGREGVDQSCLALQNRFGADVNMILFCLWLGTRGEGKENLAKYLSAALKVSGEWQRSFVQPLRDCRTNLKDFLASDAAGRDHFAEMSDLRERIKQCELDMERMQTTALYALVDDTGTAVKVEREQQRALALNNLCVYFSATGVKLDPLGQSHVKQILDAVIV